MSDKWSNEEGSSTVLIVEDEPSLAELYTKWLRPYHNVKVATDGEAALEMIDPSVDVVLLDRQLPNVDGDEVIATVRAHDYPCRVAMITAIEPDFDIIDLGIDDYLTKPVNKDEVCGVVDRLLIRARYDEQMQLYFSMASKKAILESEKSKDELEKRHDYQELNRRIIELRGSVDQALSDLNSTDLYDLLRDIALSSEPLSSSDDD